MNSMTRCLPLLGSFVEVFIEADISDGELIKASQKGFDSVSLVNQSMSFHEPLSELSNINSQAHDKFIKLSQNMNEVISFSLKLSELTDGFFDITTAALLLINKQIPNHLNFQSDNIGYKHITLDNNHIKFNKPLILDLGGIAKGFAVDKALDAIKNSIPSKNLKQAYVNAGGDIRYYSWENEVVLIPNINKQTKPIKMLNAAIATSSNYYKGGKSDIYHPKTQLQADLNKTVSVFSACCMHADGLTKVAAVANKHEVFEKLDAQVVFS